MSGSWIKCKVKQDIFSNCSNLLSPKFIKYLYFLLGGLIFIFNMISFFLAIRKTKMKKTRQTLSNAYLALFDWCFGVYLVIIATADWHYKDNYVGLEISWRNSLPCKSASFLALVSMIVSPIILCIVMTNRFCVIKWPVKSKFRNKAFVKRTIEISLTVAVCSCIILISNIFIFLGNHGLTGICLPLYTSNAHSLPLLLTTVIIATIQIFCFMTIITLVILSMYTLKDVDNCTTTQTRNNKYGKVSKHLLMVVFTNFCCWIPSSSVFLLPLFGNQLPNYFLSWITVGVVPINCTVDPILFTMLSPEMKRTFIKFYELVTKKTFY